MTYSAEPCTYMVQRKDCIGCLSDNDRLPSSMIDYSPKICATHHASSADQRHDQLMTGQGLREEQPLTGPPEPPANANCTCQLCQGHGPDLIADPTIYIYTTGGSWTAQNSESMHMLTMMCSYNSPHPLQHDHQVQGLQKALRLGMWMQHCFPLHPPIVNPVLKAICSPSCTCHYMPTTQDTLAYQSSTMVYK